MAEIIDFPEDNSPKMNPEDLKLLINENMMLQHVLRVMNDMSLDPDEAEKDNGGPIDYMQLWNNVSLQKKIDPGEVNFKAFKFYFELLSCGLDNFGESFIRHMGKNVNVAYLSYAVKCFIEVLTDTSERAEKEMRDRLNKTDE